MATTVLDGTGPTAVCDASLARPSLGHLEQLNVQVAGKKRSWLEHATAGLRPRSCQDHGTPCSVPTKPQHTYQRVDAAPSADWHLSAEHEKLVQGPLITWARKPPPAVEQLQTRPAPAAPALATELSITSSCTNLPSRLSVDGSPGAQSTQSLLLCDNPRADHSLGCWQVCLNQPEEQCFTLMSAFKVQAGQHVTAARTQQWQPDVKRRRITPRLQESAADSPLVPHCAWLMPQQSCQHQEFTPVAMNGRCPLRPIVAPAAPRLLCHLSPASLARSCNMATYGHRLTSSLQMPQTSAVLPVSLPAPTLPLIPQDYMAAAMRLLSYSEPTTLYLALHCWQVIEPRLEQGQYANLQSLGRVRYRRADMLRAGALVTLWMASKCEESRQQVAKPTVAAALLPPALAGQGAAFMTAMEVWVLQQLDWAPYKGFRG